MRYARLLGRRSANPFPNTSFLESARLQPLPSTSHALGDGDGDVDADTHTRKAAEDHGEAMVVFHVKKGDGGAGCVYHGMDALPGSLSLSFSLSSR